MFNFLRPKFKELYPKKDEDFLNYKENFNNAKRYTSYLNLPKIKFEINYKNDFENNFDGILQKAYNELGITDTSCSAIQCIKWSHFFQKYFLKNYQYETCLTMGQLWEGENDIYSPQYEYFAQLLKNGETIRTDGSGFKLHAWLTDKNGNIIDLTLKNSLKKVRQDLASGVYYDYLKSNQYNDFLYFPMIAGNDYIEIVESKSSYPLLAKEKEDLFKYTVVDFNGPSNENIHPLIWL